MSWFKKLVNNLFSENEDENVASTLEENSIKGYQENKEDSTTIDEEYLFDLEEQLLTSDFGMEFAEEVISKIKNKGSITITEAKQELKNICEEDIKRVEQENTICTYKGLQIIIVIGVNGAGKTTSIGKLANKLKQKGKKVLIAPCDTFRAAALEQLIKWAERAGATFFRSEQAKKADAILFEAIQKANAENYDALIVDTAGRLQ
ncbi:MAG TPA: signal recognition particle receptor subunit alpha, partial [Vampirovibrionales bacterium]